MRIKYFNKSRTRATLNSKYNDTNETLWNFVSVELLASGGKNPNCI